MAEHHAPSCIKISTPFPLLSYPLLPAFALNHPPTNPLAIFETYRGPTKTKTNQEITRCLTSTSYQKSISTSSTYNLDQESNKISENYYLFLLYLTFYLFYSFLKEECQSFLSCSYLQRIKVVVVPKIRSLRKSFSMIKIRIYIDP